MKTLSEGDRILELRRMMGDAIMLERAANVIARRGNHRLITQVLVRTLNRMGARLRDKAVNAHTGGSR